MAMDWVTEPGMLQDMKDPQGAGYQLSWRRFMQKYKTLVWLQGSDSGLSETEQEELLANVLKAFFSAQKTFVYDPSKGRFRYYFRTIVRNQIYAILTERQKHEMEVPIGGGEDGETVEGGVKDVVSEDPQPDDDADWRALLFRQALEIVRKEEAREKVQAFIMLRMQREDAGKIASALGVSVASVYNYSTAIFRRLQELVIELDKDAEQEAVLSGKGGAGK